VTSFPPPAPHIAVTILAAVTLLSGCAQRLVREAPFRARPDSTERGDLRGPFSGRVVDAETDRPVSGATVYVSWRFVSGYGFEEPAAIQELVETTDATGSYRIPRLDRGPAAPARLADVRIVIYKQGYVAFRSDRRFEDFGPRHDFAQAGQVVTLARWTPDHSHLRHLRYVGGGTTLAKLSAWEVPEAVAELAGERRDIVAVGPGGAKEPRQGTLGAEQLLLPEDLQSLTGFELGFEVGKLEDEPVSETYDNVHLKARGRPEAYDVALRVWRLPPAAAEQQYARLVEELPRTQHMNEIADRSVRASSETGDILGIAYLDAREGSIVLVQCGTSQCRSHDTVLALARLVRARIEARP
jgi:hypothetical protein